MEESRTILTESITDGSDSPLNGGTYSVIAARLVAYGGFGCNLIRAQVVDDHYVILNQPTVKNNQGLEEVLGVVDLDQPEEAKTRMHELALQVANDRAQSDENKVIDLTSMTKDLPKEAQYYCSTNWGGTPNYFTLKRKLNQTFM